MEGIILFFLFLFGIAIGSFLNVVSLRYVEDEPLFRRSGGRSRCMHCGKQLTWYELVPLLSYIVQLGKCRGCGARLSVQYPLVELLGGVIFTTVPLFLHTHFNAPYFVISIWVFVFLTLLLMSVIDLRLQIIPDGLTAFLSVLALVLVGYFYFFIPSGEPFGRHAVTGTFLGSYGLVFGFALDPFIRAAIGASFGLLFLGGLYVGTKGRGIGFGDVKLAGALGLLLGWPDILPTLLSAFILGSLVSVPLMVFRGKGMKTAVPFGPFIALGVAVIFFFGYDIVNAYFTLFGIM